MRGNIPILPSQPQSGCILQDVVARKIPVLPSAPDGVHDLSARLVGAIQAEANNNTEPIMAKFCLGMQVAKRKATEVGKGQDEHEPAMKQQLVVRDHETAVLQFVQGKSTSLGLVSPWGEYNFSTYRDAVLGAESEAYRMLLRRCAGPWASQEFGNYAEACRKHETNSGPHGEGFLIEQLPNMMPAKTIQEWGVGHMALNGGSALAWALGCKGNGIMNVLMATWSYGSNDGFATMLSSSGFSMDQFRKFVLTHREDLRNLGGTGRSSVVWMPYAPLALKLLWSAWDDLPIICEEMGGTDPKIYETDILRLWDELEKSCIDYLRHIVELRADTCERVLVICFEVVLACAGMALRPSFVHAVHALCKEKGILLVVDEIMTRTKCSGFVVVGSESYLTARGNVPADVVVIGKANMGCALVHSEAPLTLRAKHTDNMMLNGKVNSDRAGPAPCNGSMDMMVRELCEVRARGLQKKGNWVELCKRVGSLMAKQIVKDIWSDGDHVSVVGFGGLLYTNTCLTVRDSCGSACRSRFVPCDTAATTKNTQAVLLESTSVRGTYARKNPVFALPGEYEVCDFRVHLPNVHDGLPRMWMLRK